jgi:hypothetical protein
MLRRLFETVVQRCLAEGLVGADRFPVDASLIAADANKQRSVPSCEWKPEEVKGNAVRAAREYLATLGQRGIWGGVACDAKIHLAIRSGGAIVSHPR